MCSTFFGQSLENDDLKCEKILQEVSDNIQKNSASKFNFKLEIKSEDINEIQNGYALIEKEKFYYKTEEREESDSNGSCPSRQEIIPLINRLIKLCFCRFTWGDKLFTR